MSWTVTLCFKNRAPLILEGVPTYYRALEHGRKRMLTSGHNVCSLFIEEIDEKLAKSAFDEIEYLNEMFDRRINDPRS